jgi:sporulation protein YlmC with PRC-barrel domain
VRRLSDLLDRVVVTESGEKLGRCFDVRGERKGTKLEVTGLVIGPRGLLERLGIGPSRGEAKRHHKVWAHDAVPWKAVVRLAGGRIVVKDGTDPR